MRLSDPANIRPYDAHLDAGTRPSGSNQPLGTRAIVDAWPHLPDVQLRFIYRQLHRWFRPVTAADHQRRFGQAIGRSNAFRLKTVRREVLPELIQGVLANRFGAVPRDLPGGQIELVRVSGASRLDTRLVGEIRCATVCPDIA